MASADMPVERTMFVRKATGLVKGWSVFDAFIYSAFAINLMALGFGYAFTTTAFLPKGALIAAIILSGLFIVFEVLVYASMIAVMPRAGGDYVWQTRVFGGGVGFVLAATGWWFILWHWVPIYAQILAIEVLQPVLTILGFTGTSAFHADWWPYSTTDGNGIFVASLVTAGIATAVVAMGMRTYARVQKWCFYGGMLGLVIMLGIFLTHSKSDFITAYNTSAHNLYGVHGDAYHGLISASDKAGTSSYPGFSSFPFKETFLLLPFMVFYNLWPNWGATLYGEVRGASDFRKNIYAMGGALIATTIAAVIMLSLFAKTFGWDFYNASNNGYWSGEGPLGIFPYPGLLTAFLMDGAFWQFLLISLLALWFFGWVGTVFLSSTRVVFAAAFDRVLPEAAAKVTRNGVPIVAIMLMLIPSIPIAYFYAYNTDFYSWTLAATQVIAITFAGSAIAALIFPWRRPDVYNASPIARYKVAGLPLISVAAFAFLVILGFALYEWFTNDLYAVNDRNTLIYMGSFYVLALVIYFGSRLYRRNQGIDMRMVHSEIPAE
ncbi:MAG TPA: APC family permease [Gaiellales bacterium]|nr:APC family permease [Gaiellales bacterium]